MENFGMVEELLIDDDPEHDWRDRIRSSRASNEQRQLLLYKLSGRIRRLIGKKVQESISSINSAHQRVVLGYSEHFDLEDDNIIVRGLGTQCRLTNKHITTRQFSLQILKDHTSESPPREELKMEHIKIPMPSPPSKSPIKSPMFETIPEQQVAETIDDDIVFCTLRAFAPGQVKHMAGVVQARAIKVISDKKLEELGNERDSWWREIRHEIKENARTLACTHVIGYTEKTYIHSKGNICILSAEGTAAIIEDEERKELDCGIYHIAETFSSPFAEKKNRCQVCGRAVVPEILLSTCELPSTYVKQHFIEARIYRMKKHKVGESNGKTVSQLLPFAEYDLHKQLLYKMKLHHVNAIFNLQYNVAVSDLYIVVTVHGTGVHVPALPESSALKFVMNDNTKRSRKLNHIHQQLQALSQHFDDVRITSEEGTATETDTSTDESSIHSTDEDEVESVTGSFKKSSLDGDGVPKSTPRRKPSEPKDGYLVEIDDETDEDNMIALMDPLLPPSITLCNLRAKNSWHQQSTGRYNYAHLQNIVIQKRYSLLREHDPTVIVHSIGLQEYLSSLYHDLYTTLAFKLQLIVSGNNQRPVRVCGLTDDISFTSDHEVLISLQAMAIVQGPKLIEMTSGAQIPELLPHKAYMPESNAVGSRKHDELFEMDMPPVKDPNRDSSEDDVSETSEDDELDMLWTSKEFVTITPLYFVPGARIKTILGKVSQHLIRESEQVLDFGTFQQECIMEANAVIRAHTKALGANALLNYSIVYHKVVDNPYRKQAYTLLTVSGDAAEIEYSNEKRKSSSRENERYHHEHFASSLPNFPTRSRSITMS
jgi:uncharacterized protein YbjQ (UPF0145 family)